MDNRDLTGKRFGRLTVLEKTGSTSGGNSLWRCVCSCQDGKEIITRADLLRSGKTTSCGCLIKELNRKRLQKYFDADTKRIVRIFYGMRNRCYNKRDAAYLGWGARGITICDEWLSDTMKFVEWSKSNGYASGLSIDRIDNSRGYSPDNCRWTTATVQNNNTRSNRMFTVMRMTKSTADWARYFNVDPHMFWYQPDHEVRTRLQSLMKDRIKQLFDAGLGDKVLGQMGLTKSQIKECYG